jgi:hypothetical protein
VCLVSFTSDLQVFSELDAIAGTSKSDSYTKKDVKSLLRSKLWIIDELEEAVTGSSSPVLEAHAPVLSSPSGPKTHIVFESSSESGDGTTSGGQADVEADSEDEDDVDKDDSDDDETLSDLQSRSSYVGRGNVQAVREARKRTGLSESFRRSDALLVEFASFLTATGAAVKDIANKASTNKLV